MKREATKIVLTGSGLVRYIGCVKVSSACTTCLVHHFNEIKLDSVLNLKTSLGDDLRSVAGIQPVVSLFASVKGAAGFPWAETLSGGYSI